MKQKILLLCAVLVSAHLFDTNLRAEQTIRISQTCTEITVKPATLKLPINETSPRLSYGVEPAGTKVQISWASDNEEVATVSAQGEVTGIGYGTANITCTDAISGAKGTCVVTVASLVENLDFTEAYLGFRTHKDPVTGKDVLDIDSTIVKCYNKTLCDQLGVDSLNAYMAMLRVQLFSGLYFNAVGTLDGAERGGYIIGYSPALMVTKSANQAAPGHIELEADVVLSLGDFVVDSKEEPTKDHHMQIGQLNNDTMMYYYPRYFAAYNKAKKLTQEAFDCIANGQINASTGTGLKLLAFDANEGVYEPYPNFLWEHIPNAIITGGEFYVGGKQGSSQYMYQIDYIDLSAREVLTDDFGIPGVFVDHSDENNVKMLSTGWELSKEYTYHSGTKPSNSAKRMVRGIPMTELSHPIILPSLEEDRKIRETFEKNLSTNLLNNKALHIDNAHKTSLIGYEITACAAGCDLCHSAIAEQGEQVKIYANAVDEGNFLFWNDGNTDNPRIITAQKDTTLIAYFGMSYQCGDNLTWSFDFNTGTLCISGTGPMYDHYYTYYYHTYDAPWSGIKNLITNIVLKEGITSIGNNAFQGCSSLTSITIPNSVSSIGDAAFYGCSGLTSVTIPNSVTSIGDAAFYGCSGLTDIYCYATTPPSCENSYVFDGVSEHCYVHVPVGTKRAYELAVGWSHFIHFFEISEIPGETSGEVNVEVTENTAIFSWPVNPTASSYTLVIKKNDVVFCTLTFNSLGQLVGMAFAPARSRNQQSSAESTTYGYSFVVSNLDASSTYDYVFTAKDITDQVLSSKSGCFTTKSRTDLLTLPYEGKDGTGASKFFQNGQLYILRDGKTYTMQGTEIK